MPQVIERLSQKYEALSSNPRTAKKNKEKKESKELFMEIWSSGHVSRWSLKSEVVKMDLI
jgi:hypothetical protein